MRHVLSQVDELQKAAEEDVASMTSRHNLVIPQHLKVGLEGGGEGGRERRGGERVE